METSGQEAITKNFAEDDNEKGSAVNSNGVARNHRSLEPPFKKTSCENIVNGRKRLVGQNHFAIIDYGDRTQYEIATISFDEMPPRSILLK